jgi:hypothetical protein
MTLFHISRLDPQSAHRDLVQAVRDRTSAELVAVSDRFARSFVISSGFAPGFCCIGAEVALAGDDAVAHGSSRLSVTGNGETLETALVSCVGEAITMESRGP